jgi:hypothetical protein
MKNEELRIEMELFEEMNDSSVCDQLNNLRKQLDNILERRLKKYRGNGIEIKLKSAASAGEAVDSDVENTFIEKTTLWKAHPTRAPKGSMETVQWKNQGKFSQKAHSRHTSINSFLFYKLYLLKYYLILLSAQNNTSFARVGVKQSQKNQRTQRKQTKRPILIESPNEVRVSIINRRTFHCTFNLSA